LQAIAFGRGDRAFIVLNNEHFALSERLQTGLPEGEYCDVISCDNNLPPCGNTGGQCRPTVHVDCDGFALFNVPTDGQDPIIAIHRWNRKKAFLKVLYTHTHTPHTGTNRKTSIKRLVSNKRRGQVF